MSIDSRYGYHFVGPIELNLNIYIVCWGFNISTFIKLKKTIWGLSHIDHFFGKTLKSPKKIFPTKSVMGYKMVPISILQMQMTKIFYFCITVHPSGLKMFHSEVRPYLDLAEQVAQPRATDSRQSYQPATEI